MHDCCLGQQPPKSWGNVCLVQYWSLLWLHIVNNNKQQVIHVHLTPFVTVVSNNAKINSKLATVAQTNLDPRELVFTADRKSHVQMYMQRGWERNSLIYYVSLSFLTHRSSSSRDFGLRNAPCQSQI